MRDRGQRVLWSLGVLGLTVLAAGLLLAPWVVDIGPNAGDPGHAPAGLDAVPAELWPVLGVCAAASLVAGLGVVWRRR